MIDVEYLYIGGPYDGQWRRLMGEFTPEGPGPERYRHGEGELGMYVPTKLGHMAGFGEGQFRMSCVIMLDEPLHDVLTSATDEGTLAHGYRRRLERAVTMQYRRRLERAITMQAFREHLQRTWRAPEVLDFGPAWMVLERRPEPR